MVFFEGFRRPAEVSEKSLLIIQEVVVVNNHNYQLEESRAGEVNAAFFAQELW